MSTTSRREFLTSAGRGLAVAGFLPASGGLIRAADEGEAPTHEAAATRPSRGDLPVTLRSTHLGEVRVEDCWAAVHAVGADGVEVVLDDELQAPHLRDRDKKYGMADDSGRKRLAEACEHAKVKLAALCLANRFDERPDFELKWTSRAVQAAEALSIPTVRIDVVPRKLQGDEFFKFTVRILKQILEATEETGVTLAIENHGGTTNRPEFLEKLFHEVGSKRLGLTLDTGNFYWFGHPLSEVYKLYEKFAPRAYHTHLKSIRYPESRREERRPRGWEYGRYTCPIYEGDIDFSRVLKVLRTAGYTGDLCIENESLAKFPAPERRSVLAREVRFLRELAEVERKGSSPGNVSKERPRPG